MKFEPLARSGCLALILLAAVHLVVAADFPATPVPLGSTHTHNLFQVTPNLLSGSQPEDDAAFAELARLGVKTILSVDGARPNVEAARRQGLRYVHLPFGYDGVPSNRVEELALATVSLPTPIYVHCHHGRHRGPAAVAVMCLAGAGWTSQQADAWLQQAGTSTDYPGLFRAVWEFRPPDPARLAAMGPLPEAVVPPAVVETMVAVDRHWDRLKAFQKAGWPSETKSTELLPVQEATLLWEKLRELVRHADTAGRPADYRDKLDASEQAAQLFRQALAVSSSQATSSVDAAFKDLGQSCSGCHKIYRN